MANLTGGQYITFSKPYLEQVAEIINNGDPLKLDGESQPQVINKSPEIKKFLTAVKNKSEVTVATVLKVGNRFLPIFNGYPWTSIDKSQFTGRGGKASDGQTTAMQERASLYAIQKSIEKNGYTDRKKFFAENRDELLKLYPAMDEEWEEVFYQQQITVQKKVGSTKYGHYSRDDGFMDWMTKFAKDKYGIIKKDSWNPADIWLVSDYRTVTQLLERKIKDDVTPIQEFNAILRDMFHERKIVGISLKKMSGKVAQWELVNMDDADIFDDDEYSFELDSAMVDCTMKNATEFKTTDARINMNSKKQKITFQIRQNSPGISNLKIEATDISASSARLGKAPLPMVANVFRAYGLTLDNDNRNYPKTAAEFEATYSTWRNLFISVQKYTGLSSEEKFRENMITIYNGKRPDFALSKLMQMRLFESIFKLKGDKLDSILTELAYLAQKKGAVFGPFGKLY